jgi:hypothetical protein
MQAPILNSFAVYYAKETPCEAAGGKDSTILHIYRNWAFVFTAAQFLFSSGWEKRETSALSSA